MPLKSWVPRVARIIVAATAVPLAILSHESGHYVCSALYRLPEPILHYASTGFGSERQFWEAVRASDMEAARRIAPPGHVAVSAAAGPAISLLLMIAAAIVLCKRRTVFAAVLGIASGLRLPPVLVLHLTGRNQHTDEAHIALLTGFPGVVSLFLGLLALALVIYAAFRPRPQVASGQFAAQVIVALIVGMAAYLGWLGPELLP